MDFTWLESLIYGLISGAAEFLPVSAQAHQAILLKLFGVQGNGSLLGLMVHLGGLAGLIVACRGQLAHLKRERALAKVPKRRRRRQPNQKSMLDIQIVRTAFIALLPGFVLYYFTSGWRMDLSKVALFLLINGILLFIPRVLPSGNKDSRSMSRLDSILMGLLGGLSMLPGISRTGVTTSVSLARGADRQQALNWSLLLSIPVLVCMMGMDIYGLVAYGAVVTFRIFALYLLSAAASFCGAYLSITLLRFMAVNVGYSCFAYYSWGAALFAFILYMTI